MACSAILLLTDGAEDGSCHVLPIAELPEHTLSASNARYEAVQTELQTGSELFGTWLGLRTGDGSNMPLTCSSGDERSTKP